VVELPSAGLAIVTVGASAIATPTGPAARTTSMASATTNARTASLLIVIEQPLPNMLSFRANFHLSAGALTSVPSRLLSRVPPLRMIRRFDQRWAALDPGL
jgi:hypothetical protein